MTAATTQPSERSRNLEKGSSSTATARTRGAYARSEATRARLLSAALAEANERGIHQTSVAHIAGRAGVSVGILNYHFGSKQDLLRQLMASLVEDFLARLSADPPDRAADFFEREASMLRTYLGFLRANPYYVRLAEEVRVHDPALYRSGIQAHVKHLEQRLRCGVERGDLRPLDGDQRRSAAYLLLGAYTFLDRLLADDAAPGDDAVIASLTDLLRGGLAAT